MPLRDRNDDVRIGLSNFLRAQLCDWASPTAGTKTPDREIDLDSVVLDKTFNRCSKPRDR
ncbi:hypothetical protein Asi03nite_71910 [Actinoplanes siamensis]|uniref:Uncharacterized protein n=1 Tax=Actinoplanes siamensis TaxID=1223317 RepID=A0A919TQ14_9ACTN|nr:hypothetical protein Asi03nite_71910 [Actinoplanes siamensis]